jgi:hypothetical protein
LVKQQFKDQVRHEDKVQFYSTVGHSQNAAVVEKFKKIVGLVLQDIYLKKQQGPDYAKYCLPWCCSNKIEANGVNDRSHYSANIHFLMHLKTNLPPLHP